MDDRGHRHAEGRLAVIGRPGGLGDGREVIHPLQARQIGKTLLVEKIERGIERTAGDDVTGGAGIKLGVQRCVVFGRRSRREDDLDARVLRFESRDDLFLPDLQVVVTPAFNGQRHIGCMRQADGGQQARCEKQAFQNIGFHFPLLFSAPIARRCSRSENPLACPKERSALHRDRQFCRPPKHGTSGANCPIGPINVCLPLESGGIARTMREIHDERRNADPHPVASNNNEMRT
ncbi:hypothetical protein RHSP_47492 [Rhizobium freirei PRF 81]|uniref:Uncharacterized protein n=1 Tax=Rhizobium freirei PRF 81 TaxID=363754 RepID=N6U5A4_9HYPH|nr:hypothetical protein RHSP_47492 [Rhizobium freirei PRF 81]